MKQEAYKDKGGHWRWRIKRKGRIVACSGESFASRRNAVRALSRFVSAFTPATTYTTTTNYTGLIDLVRR